MTENKYMPGKEVQDALDRLDDDYVPSQSMQSNFHRPPILDVPELTKGGVSHPYIHDHM